MFFEQFLIVSVIFSTLPFDSLLDIHEIPMTPELTQEIRILFLSYIETNVFLYDLSQHNLNFHKESNYYKNMIEKFIAYHVEQSVISIPKSIYGGTSLDQVKELNSQFIYFIREQEALVFPPFIQDLSAVIMKKVNLLIPVLPSFCYIYSYILPGIKSLVEVKALYIISYHGQMMFVFKDITPEYFVALAQSYIPVLIKDWGIIAILIYKIPLGGLFKNFAGQYMLTN